MRIAATGLSCRDQDHRRALQSLHPGKLPRADRYHVGLRRRLGAVLPDGRAAARRVDEAASDGAPCGMALRDRQAGWQGSLRWKTAFPGCFQPLRDSRGKALAWRYRGRQAGEVDYRTFTPRIIHLNTIPYRLYSMRMSCPKSGESVRKRSDRQCPEVSKARNPHATIRCVDLSALGPASPRELAQIERRSGK